MESEDWVMFKVDMQVVTERSSSLMRFISLISVAVATDVALTSRVGAGGGTKT